VPHWRRRRSRPRGRVAKELDVSRKDVDKAAEETTKEVR
jgi:hypothetical protein